MPSPCQFPFWLVRTIILSVEQLVCETYQCHMLLLTPLFSNLNGKHKQLFSSRGKTRNCSQLVRDFNVAIVQSCALADNLRPIPWRTVVSHNWPCLKAHDWAPACYVIYEGLLRFILYFECEKQVSINFIFCIMSHRWSVFWKFSKDF